MAFYYKIHQEEMTSLCTPEGIKVYKRNKCPTRPSIKFDFTKHVLIELLDDETPEKELWKELGLANNEKVVHKQMTTDSHRTNCRRAIVVCSGPEEAKLLAKHLSQSTVRNRCLCAIVIHELLSDMCLFEKQITQHGDTRPHHQLLYVSDMKRSLSPSKLAAFLKEKFCSFGTILSVFVSDKKDEFAAPEGVIKFAFLSEAYAAELACDQSVVGMQRISVTVNQNILLAQCDLKARLREALFKNSNDSLNFPANETGVFGFPSNYDNHSCSSFITPVSSSSSALDTSVKESFLQQDGVDNTLKSWIHVPNAVSSGRNEGFSMKNFYSHSSLGAVHQISSILSSVDDQVVLNNVSQDYHPSLKSEEVKRLSSVPTWSSKVNEWISDLPPVKGGPFDLLQLKGELISEQINDSEQDNITEIYSSSPSSVVSSFVTCKETNAVSESISSRHSDITSTNQSFATCEDALNESFADSNYVDMELEDNTELDNTIVPLEDDDLDLSLPLCGKVRMPPSVTHATNIVEKSDTFLRQSNTCSNYDLFLKPFQVLSDSNRTGNLLFSKKEENKFISNKEGDKGFLKSNGNDIDSPILRSSHDITVPLNCAMQSQSTGSSSVNNFCDPMDITFPTKAGLPGQYLVKCTGDNDDSMNITVPLNPVIQTESFKSQKVDLSSDSLSFCKSSVLNHDSTFNSALSKGGSSMSKKMCFKKLKINHLEETENIHNCLSACLLYDLKVVLNINPKLDAIAKQFSASDYPEIKLSDFETQSFENSGHSYNTLNKHKKDSRIIVKANCPVNSSSANGESSLPSRSIQVNNSMDITVPLNGVIQAEACKSCAVESNGDSTSLSEPSVTAHDYDLSLSTSVSSLISGSSMLSQKLSLKRQKVNCSQESKKLLLSPISTRCLSDLRVVLNSDPELDAIAKEFSVSDPPVIKLRSSHLSGEESVNPNKNAGGLVKPKSQKFQVVSSSYEKKVSSEKSSQAGSIVRRSTRLASLKCKRTFGKSIPGEANDSRLLHCSFNGKEDESLLRNWLKKVLSLSTNNTLLSCKEGTKSIVCAARNKDVLISVGCSHMTCEVCYPGTINLLLGYD